MVARILVKKRLFSCRCYLVVIVLLRYVQRFIRCQKTHQDSDSFVSRFDILQGERCRMFLGHSLPIPLPLCY